MDIIVKKRTISMFNAVYIIIIVMFVVFGPHVLSPAWAEQEGDRIVEPYKQAVVQITTQFRSGEESGFGFVVGERNNQLYVITANHVVRSRLPDNNTIKVRLQFYHDPGGRPVEAELLQVKHVEKDLALLRVPVPDRFKLNWQSLYQCTRFECGEKAWFIGREGGWFVPTDCEAGSIYKSASDLINGYIELGIHSVKPGKSGAPLITRRGIIGIITEDAGSNANAVPVQFIRKFVQSMRFPWNLAGCRGTTPPGPSTDPITGMQFVSVEPGCFQMGSNDDDSEPDEKPVHQVCLTQSYYLGKYEVTQTQWQKVMGDNSSSNFNGNNKPVDSVKWNEVQSFIRKLNQQTGQNYRLPTEAEWEYACRSGGKNQKYCGSNNADSVAWYDDNSESTTHNVGQKQPNGLGLYDMSGNVWEWVQDRYAGNYYSKSPTDDPKGPSGGFGRVSRGGSWSRFATSVRSANRGSLSPDGCCPGLGFRLARTR